MAAVVCLALAIAVILRGRRTVPPSRFALLGFNLVAWFVADALVLGEIIGETSGLALRGVIAAGLPSAMVGFFAAFSAEDDRFANAAVLVGRVLSGSASRPASSCGRPARCSPTPSRSAGRWSGSCASASGRRWSRSGCRSG